jgi:hypothetical protein
MTRYLYITIEYDVKRSLIDQINEHGKNGFRFHSMAQEVSSSMDLQTGKPKMKIVLLFEKVVKGLEGVDIKAQA